jgi:ribosomal-protein-alanine N-acetyltransferase
MIRLVAINASGQTEDPTITIEDPNLRTFCSDCRAHYDRVGFYPPWIGYLAVRDDVPMALCGFRGPPDEYERVEIAYRIAPGCERQGLGGPMLEALIGIARDHNPRMTLFTVTEPGDEGSTHLLTRLGFTSAGECDDPYLGRAWRWWLEPGDQPTNL